MGKNKFFIPLLTFGMLLSALVGCGTESSSSKKAASSGDEVSSSAAATTSGNQSSSSSKASSSSSKASSSSSSSSQAPVVVHHHDIAASATPVKTVKNKEDKDVSLYNCKDNDGGKIMTIAFGDYSEKNATFSDLSAPDKHTEVSADIKAESYQISANGTVTWKVLVDKAITGAKLYFGAVATSSGHNTSTLAEKCSVKINDGNFANWDYSPTATYSDVGLNQTSRVYVYAATFNLNEGENSITLQQGTKGDRLLYSGDVRIAYDGDAMPVAAPATGYDITFVPAEHCKVLVYLGKNETVETNKAQSVNADATDPETNRYIPAKYFAGVEDDPLTTDVDESVAEVKPEIQFKLQFDNGYTADGNDITISGTMGNEWNKLCSEDADVYSITKIKAAITVSIAVRQITGEEPAGYLGTFSCDHGTIVVYLGAKNKAGDNIDTADASGKYLSRNKDTGEASKAKAQFNFEVFPENGYEFVSGLALKGESSPIGVTQFATGNFGNFKRDSKNGNLYSITKVASNIVVNIVCTPIAQA